MSDDLTANSGSPDCLGELFAELRMPSDGTAPCIAADFDGDGENEYVVRFTRPAGEQDGAQPLTLHWLVGRTVIFDRSDEGFAPAFDLTDLAAPRCGDKNCEERAFLNPVIYAVEDVNLDARPEVLLTTSDCGAHTCFLALYVLTYRHGEYVSIIGELGPGVSVPITDNQVRIEDAAVDGMRELVIRAGVIMSAGAGPQREATRTYRWDGESYVLANVEYDPSDLRYFKVRDADDTFDRREYEQAIALYRQAGTDAGLREWGDDRELFAYARFRIGLSLAALGDRVAAAAALDDTLAADPEALHSKLAQRFREGYVAGADLSAGCAAARSFIDENADGFVKLWNYGYANPNPGAEKQPLCPF